VVYAFFTRAGFLVFQISCAALTFCLAVSAVKGGRGGLVSAAAVVEAMTVDFVEFLRGESGEQGKSMYCERGGTLGGAEGILDS